MIVLTGYIPPEFGWKSGGTSRGDLLSLVGGASRSAFQVPHGEEQDAAGQDQRQRLREQWASASWQRTWGAATVSQVSGFASYSHARVVQFGPILGGLFLEEEVTEIGPGTGFTPDHDQRHVGSFGMSYDARRFWASFTGRYESGTPLEVYDDELDELRERPGSELVDLERGGVKPRMVFDVSAGRHVLRRGGIELGVRGSVLNLTGRRWAYNFGNPFSGTDFGPGRTVRAAITLTRVSGRPAARAASRRTA